MSVRILGGAIGRRAGHFGAWRALTAVPAMIGSLLLLLVLFGWLGSWEPLVLLAWLASGAAVCTRVGERVAVRVGCGFRRPSVQQLAMLEPTWVAALTRCGLAPGNLDLYVQRSKEANAYAAGGRSVSVTTGVVQEFRARRLVDEYLLGILCHELGHHATKAPRFALVTVWLGAPWRFAARVVIGIGLATVGRRQPLRLLAVVVITCVVVAVVQAVQQRQWAVAVVLSAVAVCGVVCPLADAAVSRRSEYAADGYAASVGVGPQLAAGLQVLAGDRGARRGLLQRMLSRHPDVDRRIERLERASGPLSRARVAGSRR